MSSDSASQQRRTLWQEINYLRSLYWRVKTACWYGAHFKSLGRGSIIRNPMLIANPDCISIGERVSIRDGVRLEAVKDGFGRTPEMAIGTGTYIEQNVQIVCHNRIVIGRDVAIAGACAIVDVNHPFREIRIPGSVANRIADEDSYVEIGDRVFIGYGSVVLPNVRIGQYAVVGANSVVTEDVPEYAIVAGVPASLKSRIKVGARDEECSSV